MKKIADFLVNKRLILFAVTVAASIVCIFLMTRVRVNEDLTKYLPKGSGMRAGLEIMETEFNDSEQPESFKLMFEGLTDEQKQSVKERIEKVDGVESVDYDPESEKYNSGDYTLFVVNTEYPDEKAAGELCDTVTEELKKDLTVYSYYKDTYNGVDILAVLVPAAAAVFLLALVLLCRSYIEIVLLVTGIGLSVLLNMGTNVIFPDISDMTRSISAVLQLALSIDYSIMLFHRYDQEKAHLDVKDNVQAMKNAVRNAFRSVSASAVTTIVGLLVLLLLSFTIGTDMGLVLAKGILCSLICVFTVMPAMIIWCDGLLCKTSKARLREARKLRKEARDRA